MPDNKIWGQSRCWLESLEASHFPSLNFWGTSWRSPRFWWSTLCVYFSLMLYIQKPETQKFCFQAQCVWSGFTDSVICMQRGLAIYSRQACKWNTPGARKQFHYAVTQLCSLLSLTLILTSSKITIGYRFLCQWTTQKQFCFFHLVAKRARDAGKQLSSAGENVSDRSTFLD